MSTLTTLVRVLYQKSYDNNQFSIILIGTVYTIKIIIKKRKVRESIIKVS